MASSSITTWWTDGEKMETVTDFIFLGSKITVDSNLTAATKLKDAPWKSSCDKPRQCTKKQRHHYADKGLCSQNYGIFSSHAWMWELDHEEGRVPKKWYLQIVVSTLEGPMKCKEIKPVSPKGNQPWILIGRIVAEAEAPVLWTPNAKSQFTGKSLMLERLWAKRDGSGRGLNGWMASPTQLKWTEQTPGDSWGQRSLLCCSP